MCSANLLKGGQKNDLPLRAMATSRIREEEGAHWLKGYVFLLRENVLGVHKKPYHRRYIYHTHTHTYMYVYKMQTYLNTVANTVNERRCVISGARAIYDRTSEHHG